MSVHTHRGGADMFQGCKKPRMQLQLIDDAIRGVDCEQEGDGDNSRAVDRIFRLEIDCGRDAEVEHAKMITDAAHAGDFHRAEDNVKDLRVFPVVCAQVSVQQSRGRIGGPRCDGIRSRSMRQGVRVVLKLGTRQISE